MDYLCSPLLWTVFKHVGINHRRELMLTRRRFRDAIHEHEAAVLTGADVRAPKSDGMTSGSATGRIRTVVYMLHVAPAWFGVPLAVRVPPVPAANTPLLNPNVRCESWVSVRLFEVLCRDSLLIREDLLCTVLDGGSVGYEHGAAPPAVNADAIPWPRALQLVLQVVRLLDGVELPADGDNEDELFRSVSVVLTVATNLLSHTYVAMASGLQPACAEANSSLPREPHAVLSLWMSRYVIGTLDIVANEESVLRVLARTYLAAMVTVLEGRRSPSFNAVMDSVRQQFEATCNALDSPGFTIPFGLGGGGCEGSYKVACRVLDPLRPLMIQLGAFGDDGCVSLDVDDAESD